MNVTGETTVGEIVAADFRAAAVFQQFGIDFCCGGRRSLADACEAGHINTEEVVRAIDGLQSVADRSPRFSEWEPGALIGYIVGVHHLYVRRELPVLLAYTQKLAAVHRERHPELHEVAAITRAVADEMTSHMAKEEHVLFPYIASLAHAVRAGRPAPAAPFGSIEMPIQMMEDEHESAGSAMARIRELTGNYAVPADGCTTYGVCLQALEAFETDLHAHVHLENNILFPRARALAEPAPAA